MDAQNSTSYRPVRTQTISVTGSSAAISNAVGSGIRRVRIIADTAVHYAVGASPTATTSDPYLPADVYEYINVREGEKVAMIQSAANGTGYVTEVSL